jgi:transglutaminase-like putative cysteine protease
VAVLPEGVNPFAFFFGAAGFLWLLVSDSVDRVRRFGRRFSGEGRDVDVWEPSPLSAAGRRLGVVGLVVAILVPLAIPGMTAGFLDRFGTGPGGQGDNGGDGGGVAATVPLTALLRDNLIRRDEFVMVKVRTNDPGPYYLRLGTADRITKDGFDSALPNTGDTVTRPLPEYVPPAAAGVTKGQYKAEVEVVNLDLRLAPAYSQVIGVSGLDASWFYDDSTGQVYSKRASVNGRRYSVDYMRLGFSPQALRQASSIPATDSGARALSTVPVIAQVSDLVDDLIRGKSTEYDRVRAIYDHFSPSNGFSYSLTTEEGNSGNAIVDFLTAKRGFCVQYAAAMAWLVREAGYPARVAFGFTRGIGARNGAYSLTNFNLHAWTEVFFPDFGWVPFDPTPPASIVGSVSPQWAPDTTESNTPQPTAAPEPAGSAGPAPSIDPNRDPNDPGAGDVVAQDTTPVNPWWIVAAAALAVFVVLLLLPAARRRALRRSRATRGGRVIELGPAGPDHPMITDPAGIALARRDAHSAWAELVDTMVDFGIPVDPSETPRTTAERLGTLVELSPEARPQAGVIAQAEERARYARAPMRADRLDEAVGAVRAGFHERATRTTRLRATLFPRSVLMRWRLGWIGFLSRNIRVAGRVRDAVLTLSPRRLLALTRSR